MPNSLRLAALPALLVLLQGSLTGCGTIQEDRRAEALLAAANTHHEAVRWGYWEAVVELMHADARKDLDLSALKNVRVTGYEVVGPSEITPEGKSLRLARIDYVLQDEQRLKQVLDRQDWRWDDTRKVWLLHSGLPAF
jgi:hypothetical protein